MLEKLMIRPRCSTLSRRKTTLQARWQGIFTGPQPGACSHWVATKILLTKGDRLLIHTKPRQTPLQHHEIDCVLAGERLKTKT